ncbi:hypothetical protein [Verminephrobacter eiseniae]|uniref:hypothetical protein n=1 Tax=Verminephrobacter eiseniae TaxID=364317 RepID=UPI0012ED8A98|nr:hypothetical protein [Verminephrobacter eiseniae]
MGALNQGKKQQTANGPIINGDTRTPSASITASITAVLTGSSPTSSARPAWRAGWVLAPRPPRAGRGRGFADEHLD